MYIKSYTIEQIRSITQLHFEFDEDHLAGWHVVIGENGTGKTTIIRAISLAILGPGLAPALRESWANWVAKDQTEGKIQIEVALDSDADGRKGRGRKATNHYIPAGIKIERKANGRKSYFSLSELERDDEDKNPYDYVWSGSYGWFSAAFGPFRRFRGGEHDKEKVFASYPKVGAHITAYGEDAALTEIESWLVELYYRFKVGDKAATEMLNGITTVLSQGGLLPHQAKIEDVNADGIFFVDGNGNEVELLDLSDGFRSILSLTMELLRQLIDVYGHEAVFESKEYINLPGVVLIDEIDAHLHPTWQTRIGQWFTKYFPRLQFIVTTHSPLICRACGEHGKIFRLAAPGSDMPSGEITGVERDRLVYGDILEAYETDMFGDGVEWSDEGRALQKEYRDLILKVRYRLDLTEREQQRLDHLKQIFHANVEAS